MKNVPESNKRGSINYVKGPFNYSQIDANLADEARAAALKINTSKREHVITVGVELIKIKEKLPDGQFLDWIDRELNFSAATCRNYMAAARSFYDAPLTVSTVPLKALYRFAGTASDVRDPIVARIEAGLYVDREEVEQAIRKPKVQKVSTALDAENPRRDPCAELMAAWNAASPEARQEFLSRIVEQHGDGGQA